jgi:hypothetical protein
MGDLVENQSDMVLSLTDAIQDFAKAIDDLQSSLKNCREAGFKDGDIRDAILYSLPESERPMFMQQWPMLSMMLSAIQ